LPLTRSTAECKGRFPREEAEGDESRVVAAVRSAAAECAGKSPPPAPAGARDGRFIVRCGAYRVPMRRLRPLSEAECYARCYGGWEATVRIVRLEPRRPRSEVLLTGEAIRRRFEELFAAREPDELPEPEAA
jgi:hypothetical protein